MRNSGLDELSHWLREDKQFGYAVLFALIFLTTFREFLSIHIPEPIAYRIFSSNSSVFRQ